MRTVIDRIVWDTEAEGVEEIARWSNGKGANDFGHVRETLHRTPSGRYFLHGIGGPRTRYAQSVPTGGWSGGEAIRPLTDAEAANWLERHDKIRALKEHFGDELEPA